MAKASATISIPASADVVWQRVGGFLSLGEWLPQILKSEAGEGGRLRHLTVEGGVQITERLEHFDNSARTYSYSIISSPFPVTEYLATLTVTADGEHSSQVQWSGSFTPNGVSEAEAEALFLGVYEDGMKALRDNF